MRAGHYAVAGLSCVAMMLVAPDILAGPESTRIEPAPERLPLLEPTIVEYRWTFLTPEWTDEPRKLDARVYAPTLHARRVDYAVLDLKTERRKVGRIAEFGCKYADFALPNECRTTWRDVYVDLPVPVVRHDYIDVDVPHWSWQDWQTSVDVPRLVWKQETLVVSLPALAVPAARSR